MKNLAFRVALIPVKKGDKQNLETFLRLSHQYFMETWPEFFDKQFNLFSASYKSHIQEKSRNEARHLFLFQKDSEIIGLTNIFFTGQHSQNIKIAYIAEFYIQPPFRQQRLGMLFFNQPNGVDFCQYTVHPYQSSCRRES
jgi:hypothetical protein